MVDRGESYFLGYFFLNMPVDKNHMANKFVVYSIGMQVRRDPLLYTFRSSFSGTKRLVYYHFTPFRSAIMMRNSIGVAKL